MNLGVQAVRDPTGARLRAPLKAGLSIALGRIDILVHRGAVAYAEALEHEAGEPGRDPLARRVLDAVASAVREAA